MNEYIAYCGLDCGSCAARLATVHDDADLRVRVAEEWSALNGVEITPEMINCTGCRVEGVKTPYCESLCPIRLCALAKGLETCGGCGEMGTCGKLSAITGNNPEALDRLLRKEPVINEDCPCLKVSCRRHGNCEECRKHHAEYGNLTACERAKAE